MKKFVSMFMVLVMAFTMGPNMVVRAQESACEGEECRVNDESLTGWAWCKENPKDCIVYGEETAWNKTKELAGKVKDGAIDLAGAFYNHNYTQTWEDIKNYNYTQGFEMVKDNVKWACDKTVNGTKWLSEKADEAMTFKKRFEDFYNYDLNEQPKWTFWTLLTTAGVGVLTMGTWALNLITCCGCGRCRLRMP